MPDQDKVKGNFQRLKIGILLDTFNIPTWAFNSLERVKELDCVDISIIILNNPQENYINNPEKIFEVKENRLDELFNKIDKSFFMRGPDAFEIKDTKELFINIPILCVEPSQCDNSGNFSSSIVTQVINCELDILIQMGFENLSGDILTVAKYGVWSYYFGDPEDFPVSVAGFWEVMNHHPVTCSIIHILNDQSNIGKIVYKSYVQTFQFSPARNRNRCFWQSASFLSRQIKLLHQLGEEMFFKEISKYSVIHKRNHLVDQILPSTAKLVWLYLCLFSRNIIEILQRVFNFHQWYLLIAFDNPLSSSLSIYIEITPPKDRFWADPHIVNFENRCYIFIEEYIYREKKAHLSVSELMSNGELSEPIQIISKDYHLSYPSVFKVDDTYYMIPETSAHKTIELYECEKFPYEWKFKMNLMEGIIAVDTTVLFYKNKWWLFTGVTENEGAFPENELFLFYSDELFTTNWISHPLNPIVSDVRNARPAGDIYLENGKMLRPSQECSRNYGWGININEILHLSETEYQEKKIFEFRPDWDEHVIGVHTFSPAGSITMADAVRKRRKLF